MPAGSAGGIRPCDKLPCAELLLFGDDDRGRVVRLVADLGLGSVVVPRPSVAEPERREKVKFGRLWPHVARGDANADIVGRGLGVVRGDLPIPVAVEYSGVEKLEFGIVPRTARVLLPQASIRKLGLRIVIAPAEPGGGRGRVEIPPVFLGVLAMIALRPAETEDSLLQDGIASVPERERETKMLPPIAEPSQAVLAPAVGARARVVERKVAPGVAVGAIVLAHGAPRAFRDIRADELPIAPSRGRRSLREPRVLGGKGRICVGRCRSWWRHPSIGLHFRCKGRSNLLAASRHSLDFGGRGRVRLILWPILRPASPGAPRTGSASPRAACSGSPRRRAKKTARRGRCSRPAPARLRRSPP